MREFVRLYAPQLIDVQIAQPRQATLLFCKRVRQSFLQDGVSLILDFSLTRRIHAMGMLIVIAEIDRAQRMAAGRREIRVKLPGGGSREESIVRQVLDQLELLKRARHPEVHADKSDFDETVRHWRYATGTRVDDTPGDVLEEHEGRIAPGLMTKMQIGLTEALINSLNHAYQSSRMDGCEHFNERRWWMFTHEVDGMLEVLVCDLGIGIPRSLPITWDRGVLKKLRAIFSNDHPDLAAIKSALILGESSTGDEHRGKGLPQIWHAVEAAADGRVGIMSGKAYLGFKTPEDEVTSGSYNSCFMGTLISWRVPVDAPGDEPDG
jgi:hypothetical protein